MTETMNPPAAADGIASPVAGEPLESVPPPVPNVGQVFNLPRSSITVFTNGCFDLLHMGHVYFLKQSRLLGDRLIVGLNSDDSVRRLKGIRRPIRNSFDRLKTLKSIRWVDEAFLFDEDTPCELIKQLKPDIIVKGPGYSEVNMPEAAIVKSYGGRIVILDGPAISTTDLIETILQRYSMGPSTDSADGTDSEKSRER